MSPHKTWRRVGVAAALSAGLGLAGRWRGALSISGAVGALLTGTAIAGAGGWDWGAALVYFFVSSSALSRVASARKLAAAADKFEKGSQRDIWQALANAGIASALALARATPWGARHAHRLRAACAGALAAANADTWATEIGTLSLDSPRLLTTGRPVAPGTSGGVTPLGLAASATGAATVGLAFALAGRATPGDPSTGIPQRRRAAAIFSLTGAALAGGLAGSLADSLLGATIQAMRWCPRCQVETERRIHRCGVPTTHLRGLRWVDNDLVNAVCTLVGAAVAASVAATSSNPRPD